jgi:hypothetical protein
VLTIKFYLNQGENQAPDVKNLGPRSGGSGELAAELARGDEKIYAKPPRGTLPAANFQERASGTRP